MNDDFYLRKKRRYLKNFAIMSKHLRAVLLETFAEYDADKIIGETRDGLVALLPEIPYIGGDGNPLFTAMLAESALWLALYRSLGKRNIPLEKTGEIIRRTFTMRVQSWPFIARAAANRFLFSRAVMAAMRRRAVESQKRQHKGGWVFTFSEDSDKMGYLVEYTECAICEFYEQQGAAGLARFNCANDFPLSDALGWGLTRTMTIAQGHGRCDFHFRKTRPGRYR